MSANHSRISFSRFFRCFRAFFRPIRLPPFYVLIISRVHVRVNEFTKESTEKPQIFQPSADFAGGFVLGEAMVTQEQIKQWVAAGNELAFYVSYDWKKKRREVLALDKHECQKCKSRGKYSKAVMVHHVKHLRDRPDLALSVWDMQPDGAKTRQLVSLCDDCHNAEHPERMKQYQQKEPLTKERW